MARDYDLFIAYHGTNSKNGTYDVAKKIANFLIDKGYSVYVHHYASLKKDQGIPFYQTYQVTARSQLLLLLCNDALSIDGETHLITSTEINKEIDFFEQSHTTPEGKFNTCLINCVYFGNRFGDEAASILSHSHRAFLGANLLGNRNDFANIEAWISQQISEKNKSKEPSILYTGVDDDIQDLLVRYIDSYTCSSIGNAQLPREKLIRCIYANVSGITHREPLEKVIEDFKRLYIYKKIYLNDGNSKNDGTRVKDLIADIIEDVRDQAYYTLIGEPGSGKSTFLYYSFIQCLQNMIESHIIPIFVDLKGMKEESEIQKTILNNLLIPFQNISIFAQERFHEVIQCLKKDYTFFIFIDSYDESYINRIGTSTHDLFGISGEDIKFKVLVAMREYAFKDQKFQSNNATYLANVYKVCDYCYQEVQIFIDNLIEMKIIENERVEKLKKAIALIEFDHAINPFLASKMVEIILNNENRRTDKIVDLLYFTEQEISHRAIDRNEKSITDERVYWVIGLRGQNNLLSSKELSSFVGLSHDVYLNAVDLIANQTYLLDNKQLFYQQLYSDFYGAKFILESFVEQNIVNDLYIENVIYRLLNHIEKKAEVFAYVALLTDYEIGANNLSFHETVLKRFLDYIKDHYNQSCVEKHNVFILYKEMMRAIKKYSSPRIVKDQIPEDLHATYGEDKLILSLYREYFDYIMTNHCDIDYNDFYYIITILDKYGYALRAIYELDIKDDQQRENAFLMLSIIRDSYCQLYYGQKILYPPLKVLNAQKIKDKLCLMATHDKTIKEEMTYRELLNYVFYAQKSCFTNELSTHQLAMANIRFFPSVFNLDSWIEDAQFLQKGNVCVLVHKEHGLLFDSEQYNLKNGFSAMMVINQNEWNAQEFITLSNQVVSLCIYGQNELIDRYESMGEVRTIDVSYGFTTLADKCFYKTLYLENIILPIGLKHIGEFSLYECNYLKSLILPETITYLGESFIEDCFMLKEITIPKKVNHIGQYAFEECTSLSKVHFLTDHLIRLEDGIFKSVITLHGCLDLSHMNFLKEIGNFVFLDCEELEEIILPSSLKQIGIMAFDCCHHLKKIVFHDKLERISSLSFGYQFTQPILLDFGVEQFEIFSPEDLFVLQEKGYIKEINVEKCVENQRYRLLEDGTYELIYTFESKHFIEFQSKDYSFTISSLAIGSLGNSSYLDQVILDESIVKIGEWAFEDCNSLYHVDVEKTKIQVLSAHLFENCISLSKVLLPLNQNLVIEEFAFENCSSLRYISTNEDGTILLHKNVVEIQKYAFHQCNKIKKIVIENEKILIHPYAFSNMKNLQIIQLPAEVIEKIDQHVFFGCENLKEIIVDGEHYEIDEEMFNHFIK